MANIATCPKCAKQLGLPASITATDRAECPECHAIFSLSETVQISLPVVRVLDPAEQPATSASSLPVDVKEIDGKENVSEALASNAAPIKSWEERLKNALALDGSDDAGTPETKVPAKEVTQESIASVVKKKAPSQAPSFDFDLEPAPSEGIESKPIVREMKARGPAKTLADFAPHDEASSPSSPRAGAGAGLMAKLPDVDLPKVDLPKVDLPKVDLYEKSEATVERASTVVRSATKKAETSVQDVVQAVSRRRVERSSLPKIAALATGPVLGGILGLYGLLWVQGEKADL